MSDKDFARLLEEEVRTPFDVASAVDTLRQERDVLLSALLGDDVEGMPAALRRVGAEGATEEDKGFDAHRRRRALATRIRYQELRRSVALANRLEAMVRAEVPEDVKDLESDLDEASWMPIRKST
jgi:hypothetical protein